jgi:hypothetical protein
MTEHLGRCAEQLRHAVRHLANSSGTPQEKLRVMLSATMYGNIAEGDFPLGQLRDEFAAIACQTANDIASMSDERARRVIEQICCLSDATAYELGRKSYSQAG